MDKNELQIKQDESTVNVFAEKTELASNASFVTSEGFLQELICKDVLKSKMINVAGQTLEQYEKKLDESNQIIKGYENYIGDDKFENDVLNKVLEKKEKLEILRKMKIIKVFP